MILPAPIAKAIERGWSVIPLRLDKKPCVPWKEFQRRRATAEEAEKWQQQFNPPMWAVITGKISGIFITDHDLYKPGAVTLEALNLAGKGNVQTGSGGIHVYWRHPGYHVPTINSTAAKRIAAAGFSGFDLRGDGGYAAFWGRNENGRYHWLSKPDWDLNPEILPAALLDAIPFHPPAGATTPAPAAAKSPQGTPPATGKGLTPFPEWALSHALARQGDGRNAAGFWYAGMLRDQGLSRADVTQWMRTYHSQAKPTNTKGAAAPYEWSEAEASIDQVFSRPARRPVAPRPLDAPHRPAPPADYPEASAPTDEQVPPPDPRQMYLDPPGAPPAPAPEPDSPRPFDTDRHSYGLNDVGNANRLIARHGKDLRYAHASEEWFIWNRKRWPVDDTGEFTRRWVDTVQDMYHEVAKETDDAKRAALLKHINFAHNAKALSGVTRYAVAAPGIAIKHEQLDRDRFLLNFPNGTLELTSNTLREHRRADYITKILEYNYNPDETAPLWEDFITHCFKDPDTGERRPDLERFVQKAMGYCISGADREKVVFLFHGLRDTGKTTFLDAMRAVLGEYSGRIRVQALLLNKSQRNGDEPTPELFNLRGRRLVVASEIGENQRLDEAQIKDLVGTSTVRARQLHGNPVEFPQTFKIIVDTNVLPLIYGDDSIWQKIRAVPFLNIPARIDRSLKQKLLWQVPGIMAWCVRGFQMWQEEGLGMVEAVRSSTADYRAKMDSVGRYLADCCVLGAGFSVQAKEIYDHYQQWCEQSNEVPLGSKTFAGKLGTRRIEGKHTATGTRYSGIRILSLQEATERAIERLQPSTPPDTSDTSDTCTRNFSHEAAQQKITPSSHQKCQDPPGDPQEEMSF